jgi:predicted glycosyltransferase
LRFLFDIVHPAHVHFYKHVIRGLEARGHATRVVARSKDVTTQLLDRLGIPYETVGKAGRKSLLQQGRELLERDLELGRRVRSFRPDLIATRSPAGAQVGRALGVRSVFDTDDGRAAGLHFWAAAAFAHVITTPDCTTERYGRRQVLYPGYKQTAYLHPAHFRPDPQVLDELGVREGERYFLVRFVAMEASHDGGEGGLSAADKGRVVELLSQRGKVFVSCEGQVPEAFQPLRFPLPPDRMHDALAFADLLVGDSQTMAAEAAVLGTPSLRVSSWTGRLAYLLELEQRYGLTFAFPPSRSAELFEQLDRWLGKARLREELQPRHQRLLAEKVDVARWYTDFLEAGAPLGWKAPPQPRPASSEREGGQGP